MAKFKENWRWYLITTVLVITNALMVFLFFKARKNHQVEMQNQIELLTNEQKASELQTKERVGSQLLILCLELIRMEVHEGRAGDIQAGFEKTVRLTNVLSLEILNEKGMVLVSDNASHIGQNRMEEYDRQLFSEGNDIKFVHRPAETLAAMRLENDDVFDGFLIMRYSDQNANMQPN